MTKLNSAPIMWFPRKSVFSFLLAGFFALLSIWMMVQPMWGSGIYDRDGNLLFIPGATFTDATVHLALISEMRQRFPPTNFALGGVELRNYHYLYDAGLALVSKILPIGPLDLYFRVAPVILAGLLVLAVFLTVYELTGDRLTAAFGILIVILSTSLGFLTASGVNDIFMTDQIFEMMVNPQGVLSLIIFLSLFLFLAGYERRKSRLFLVGVCLLVAVSFGVKAYGGIVFGFGAVAAAGWFVLRRRDYFPSIAVLVGLVIMGFWLVFNLDRSVVGLTLAPFWLIDHMVRDVEHLNLGKWALFRDTALRLGDYRRLAAFYAGALAVYIVGSLGLRLIGIIAAVMGLSKAKKASPSRVFLVVTAFVSFLIPLAFNQGRKPYDIVQFTPYFTLVAGLALVIFLKKKPIFLALVALSVLFMDKREVGMRLTTESFENQSLIRTADHILVRGSRIVFSRGTIEAMDYIKKNTPTDAIFLLAPSKLNMSSLWFPSLAERRTVYSGVFFDYQVGKDTEIMMADWQKIFSSENTPVKFDYAFLDKEEMWKYDKVESKYGLKRVYSNNDVVVLKR